MGEHFDPRPRIGDLISFSRADGIRTGRVVAWHDDMDGSRTFVAEVEGELAPYSSDGRWHVSEHAATLRRRAD